MNRLQVAAQLAAFMAGRHSQARDKWLERARAETDKGIRRLYASFARDHHRDYIKNIHYACHGKYP